jgi:hypothetical protein
LEGSGSVFAASQLEQCFAVFEEEFGRGDLKSSGVGVLAEEFVPGFDAFLVVGAVAFEHADEGIAAGVAVPEFCEVAGCSDGIVVASEFCAAGSELVECIGVIGLEFGEVFEDREC